MNDILILETISSLYIEGNSLQIRVGHWDYTVTCLSRNGEEQKIVNKWNIRRHDHLEEKLILKVEEGYFPASTGEEDHTYQIVLHFQDKTQETFSWKLDRDWRADKGHLKISGRYHNMY